MNEPKAFLFFIMCAGFAICGEYAITRPASNALFLTQFSVTSFPYVWLATVPLNLLVIYLYNRFLPIIGPLKMIWTFALLTICVNALTGHFYSSLPELIFFQFAWKDIYILLMLKQLWSLIHSTIPKQSAKYLYGAIYGMGTLGGISGSFIPSFFAVDLGSEHILFFTLPVYLFALGAYTMAYRKSAIKENGYQQSVEKSDQGSVFSYIRNSPILIAVLLLVIFMQVSVGLMEYQFNAHMQLNILDKDLRTAYAGKIGGLVNLLSLCLQFIGAFFVVHTLGLKKSQFMIPVLLGISALFSFTFPSFAILSSSFVLIKAVDFSLFGVIKEMLYAPLQLDEKFRAKAIIDVFAYRTSKAFVSVGLLALQALAGSYLLQAVGIVSIATFIGWLIVVAFLYRWKISNAL